MTRHRWTIRVSFVRAVVDAEPLVSASVGFCQSQISSFLNPLKRRVKRVQVVVRDNNVDQALRALKKKMQREGIFREMKLRNYYEKPSEKRAREKAEAIRRARKLARKKAQREGLVSARPRTPTRAPR
jgi:small subunit ribosomal protein S21